jgi:hypothetical protein
MARSSSSLFMPDVLAVHALLQHIYAKVKIFFGFFLILGLSLFFREVISDTGEALQ